MNKQSIGKLNMFFMGITQRNLDNRDFFIELEVIFKSGRKEFKGIAIEEDNKYKFNFKGKSDLYLLSYSIADRKSTRLNSSHTP